MLPPYTHIHMAGVQFAPLAILHVSRAHGVLPSESLRDPLLRYMHWPSTVAALTLLHYTLHTKTVSNLLVHAVRALCAQSFFHTCVSAANTSQQVIGSCSNLAFASMATTKVRTSVASSRTLCCLDVARSVTSTGNLA